VKRENRCARIPKWSRRSVRTRRAAAFERLQNIVEDHVVARLVGGQRRKDFADQNARRAVERRRQSKLRYLDLRPMRDARARGKRPRVRAIADGTALHEDNRMVTVLSRDRRGKTEHVFCVSAPDGELETGC
jgi:hypothetical protein